MILISILKKETISNQAKCLKDRADYLEGEMSQSQNSILRVENAISKPLMVRKMVRQRREKTTSLF